MDYRKTDAQFMERFEHFAFDEVVHEKSVELDPDTKNLAILSCLIGCQGKEAFQYMLQKALQEGLDPIKIKEMVYQSVDYVGMAKMWPFLEVTNEVFSKLDIPLDSHGQSMTTMENRLEKGAQTQVQIFGEGMKEAWKNGVINYWLADNCFGDYYTRTGLDLAQRELITFCFLMAQGGCEPQLVAHAKGNMNMGNDADFLCKVVANCVPYIGYPRSLNALRCIEEAKQ